MKQVCYLDGEPIKRLGENSREFNLKFCMVFSELEAEHIFIAAGKVEGFVNNIYRILSLEDSYVELKEMEEELRNSHPSHSQS